MPDSADLDRTRNASFFGLALRTFDIHCTAATLAGRLGESRPAVQEGRTIATLRKEAGSSIGLAFMTPAPARSAFQPE